MTFTHKIKNIPAYAKEMKQFTGRSPVTLGRRAVEFFRANFDKRGFVDNKLNRWTPSKKKKGSTLVRSGRLRNSIRVTTVTNQFVQIATDVPYAQIHNEGGTIKHPGGSAFFLKKGKNVWVSNRNAKGKKFPRTKPHTIKIPKRQFMGGSKALENIVDAHYTKGIGKLTQKHFKYEVTIQ